MAESFYSPTNNTWVFPFLHILSNSCYAFFLITIILTSVKWYLIVIFICISLIIIDVEHLFMHLLAMCMSSLEKISIHILYPFLNQICFGYSVVGVLHIFWILIPYQYMACKYILPFRTLPFPLVGFLCCAELFNFDIVPLIYFCFFCLCF